MNDSKSSDKTFADRAFTTQTFCSMNSVCKNRDDCQTIRTNDSTVISTAVGDESNRNVSTSGTISDDFVTSARRDWRQKLCRSLCCAFPAVFVAIVYFCVRGRQDSAPFDAFVDVDPFNGIAYHWRNRGRGLYLQVINALDETWQSQYEQALLDWNNGEPDVLSLESVRDISDAECDPVLGKIKLCNAEYGETGWKGINTLVVEFGYITVSTAKMNDSYLKKDKYQFRQYTLCHEMGHGFGLPHADENFNNVNLGTCMDYTNNPTSNEHPSRQDFELLAWLYGSRDGNWTSMSMSNQTLSGEQSMTFPTNDSQSTIEKNTAENEENKNNEHRRNLRGMRSLPSWVVRSVRSLEKKVSRIEALDETRMIHPGWRLLSKTEYSEVHEVDLGGGYQVQFHKMLS